LFSGKALPDRPVAAVKTVAFLTLNISHCKKNIKSGNGQKPVGVKLAGFFRQGEDIVFNGLSLALRHDIQKL
jgi:hypothetical protein